MIKATSTKTDIHIAIEGTASDIMCELGETISAVYGLFKKEIDADNAKRELSYLTEKAILKAEKEAEEAVTENEG